MGEAARQPDAPNFSESPLDLFTPRFGEGSGYTWKDKHFLPLTMGALGMMVPIGYNLLLKRPFWSGIHFHILSVGGFYFLAKQWNDYRLGALSEKEAMYKHYITLHPEDFPPFEKIRIKDLFVPWSPVR